MVNLIFNNIEDYLIYYFKRNIGNISYLYQHSTTARNNFLSPQVAVGDQNSTLTDHVTYDNSVTPTITAISPGDAGTGGNKMVCDY